MGYYNQFGEYKKTGFEIIAEVGNMTTSEIRESLRVKQIEDDLSDSKYAISEMNKIKEDMKDNIPYLMDLIEEYVKYRIMIKQKKMFYKRPFRILERSDYSKIQHGQDVIINILEYFINTGQMR
jgi:hypothetical protein